MSELEALKAEVAELRKEVERLKKAIWGDPPRIVPLSVPENTWVNGLSALLK